MEGFTRVLGLLSESITVAVDAYTPLLVTCYEFAGPLDVHDEDESFLSAVRVPIRRRIAFPFRIAKVQRAIPRFGS